MRSQRSSRSQRIPKRKIAHARWTSPISCRFSSVLRKNERKRQRPKPHIFAIVQRVPKHGCSVSATKLNKRFSRGKSGKDRCLVPPRLRDAEHTPENGRPGRKRLAHRFLESLQQRRSERRLRL